MPTKDMTRRSVLVGSLAAVIASSAAHAELVLNFPLKGDAKFSREASATLLIGASQIMTAIQMAEIDREKAAAILKDGVVYLEKARQMFLEVQKRAGSASLNVEKMKLSADVVARIRGMHKIVLPKTMDELSRMAVAEVDRFIATTKEMGFDSVQKARNTTLTFSEAINRLLDVGVLVSSLAETGQN